VTGLDEMGNVYTETDLFYKDSNSAYWCGESGNSFCEGGCCEMVMVDEKRDTMACLYADDSRKVHCCYCYKVGADSEE